MLTPRKEGKLRMEWNNLEETQKQDYAEMYTSLRRFLEKYKASALLKLVSDAIRAIGV